MPTLGEKMRQLNEIKYKIQRGSTVSSHYLYNNNRFVGNQENTFYFFSAPKRTDSFGNWHCWITAAFWVRM